MDAKRLNELAEIAKTQVKREDKDAIERQKRFVASQEEVRKASLSDSEMLRLLLENVGSTEVRDRVTKVVLSRVAEQPEKGPEMQASEIIRGLMSSFFAAVTAYERTYRIFPEHGNMVEAAYNQLQGSLASTCELYDLSNRKLHEWMEHLTDKQKSDLELLQQFIHDEQVERFFSNRPSELSDAAMLLGIVVNKAIALRNMLMAKPATEIPTVAPKEGSKKSKINVGSGAKLPEKRSASRRFGR